MKIELEVKSSNPTKNGNFCNKLQAKTIITAETEFGTVEQERQVTYYLFTKKENEIGKKASVDLDLFDIVESPYKFIDEDGNEVEAMLKKMYPRV